MQVPNNKIKANMDNTSRSCITKAHRNNTYTGRWFLLTRMFLVLLIILMTTANAVQFSYAKEDESVHLYLDISFDSNLIMNKYDVSLELDGEHLDTIEYDKYYTTLCEVAPGKHVIRFYKDDDHDVMGEKVIQVNEDTTFQCQLKTKGKEIELIEPTTFEGTAAHSIEMPDCVGLHLVDALEVLKQKGFVNYRYEGDTDKKIKEKTWAVDIQNVQAGDKIDKNYEIILTCVPAEEYIEKTFTGMTYSDAIKKAKAIGYKNIKKNDSRRKDEQTELKETNMPDEAKQYWTVKSAEDNYSDDETLVLNFVYNVPMPDLLGKKVEKADSQMELIQQGHFDYDFVDKKTEESIDDEDLKKYKIAEQSIEPGTIIKYNSTITFKCKKTKAAREEEKKAEEAAKKEAEEKAKEPQVWISSGKCYHSKASCSNMKNPRQVTLSQAQKLNKRPCKKCY